jgi:hypothetical protein
MSDFYEFYPELGRQCILGSKEEAIEWFEKRYTIVGNKIIDNVRKTYYVSVWDFKADIMPIRIISGKKLISAGNFIYKHYFRPKPVIKRDLFAA